MRSSIKSLRLKYSRKGVAIRPSEDMLKFVDEVVPILAQVYYNATQVACPTEFKNKRPVKVYEREVEHEKYGKRHISVWIQNTNAYWYGRANSLHGEILISWRGLHSLGGESLAKVVLHELIHNFDPKLTEPHLRNADWGISKRSRSWASRNYVGYSNAPEEQDAEMGTLARYIISKLWESPSCYHYWPDIYKTIRSGSYYDEGANIQEGFMWSWHQNPKIWRKWQRTLLATAEAMMREYYTKQEQVPPNVNAKLEQSNDHN